MTPVREAFCRALELLEAERRAFLVELAPEMRKEVVSLIAAHESAGRFLCSPSDAALPTGERVGPYRVVELIGRGGMGLVYRAYRDDGEFQREVAIKLVGGRLFAPEAERRFISERRILALLDHPNIVRMIDGGVWQGQRYQVMELVSGEPVTAYCAKHNVSPAERLRIFQAVCEAIHYAHQRLVIHRDLKPGNILITAEQNVKVLDFGIARLLDDSAGDDPSTTLLNPFTLSCASPEQVRGEPLTVATDIYSLGLLLYELLSGRNPQSSGARVEIEQRILEEDPPAPGKIVAGISPDLDAIVAKALAKDPGSRYASVERLSVDVERYLSGLPVSARPDSLLYRARKFALRRALPLGAGGAILLALLIGGLSTLAQWRRAERHFREQRNLAHSVLYEVYDSIGVSAGSLPARRLLATRAQQYLDNLARDAGGDASLEREVAEAYLRLGDVQGRPYRPNLGDTAGALQSYSKAVTLLEPESKRHPNDPAIQNELTSAYSDVALILIRQKKSAEGIGMARRAVATAENLAVRYPRDAAYTQNLAQAYSRLGQGLALAAGASGPAGALEDVLSAYRKALKILESNGPRTEESWLVQESGTCFYVAYALRELGNRTGEIAYYRQAVESALKGDAINRRLVTAHPAQSNHRRNLADGLTEIAFLRWKCCRDLAGALRDIHSALSGFGGIADQDPDNMEARRDIANAQKNLGWILGEAGQLKEALQANREALAIYEQVRGADPSSQEDAGYIAEVQSRIAALAESK